MMHNECSKKRSKKFLRSRYTSGNSTCSLIDFCSLLEYHASKNNLLFHWEQTWRTVSFLKSKLWPLFWECLASWGLLWKDAAALECSLILAGFQSAWRLADVHCIAIVALDLVNRAPCVLFISLTFRSFKQVDDIQLAFTKIFSSENRQVWPKWNICC